MGSGVIRSTHSRLTITQEGRDKREFRKRRIYMCIEYVFKYYYRQNAENFNTFAVYIIIFV